MDVKLCTLAIFLLCAHASQSAVVPRSDSTVDTYENLSIEKGLDYGSIEDNEISDEVDSVYGLYPPKPNAKDFFALKSSYPKKALSPSGEYVIDTVNKVLKLNTDEGTEETKLRLDEEMEIKKLSAAFAEILETAKLENFDWDSPTQTEPSITTAPIETTTKDWRKLSPIITVSKSGVSIAFGNETEPDAEDRTESVEEIDPSRDSLWDAIAKSVDKVLDDELDRRLNMTDDGNSTAEDFPTDETPVKDEEAEEPSSLMKFVSSVWNVMKSSLDYVGALFSNLMSGGADVTQSDENATNVTTEATTEVTTEDEEEEVTVPPTTATAVFAYEEPTRHKRLPAEEFETRRRDIDSFFYGYGIV